MPATLSTALPAFALLGGLFGGVFGGGGGPDCSAAATADDRNWQIIARDWPLRLRNDPVRLYVQALGTRIASAAGVDGNERRFFVVRNLEPTAVAIGGQRYVVSDGLIALVRNESDLAAVLAHELAHDGLGHFCMPLPRGAELVRHGSIVQHFDLELERAADAEAVYLLTVSGFDPGSMYHVLSCLAGRPGAPVGALTRRMDALGVPAPPPAAVAGADQSAFAAARARVVEDAGREVQRCR